MRQTVATDDRDGWIACSLERRCCRSNPSHDQQHTQWQIIDPISGKQSHPPPQHPEKPALAQPCINGRHPDAVASTDGAGIQLAATTTPTNTKRSIRRIDRSLTTHGVDVSQSQSVAYAHSAAHLTDRRVRCSVRRRRQAVNESGTRNRSSEEMAMPAQRDSVPVCWRALPPLIGRTGTSMNDARLKIQLATR